MEDNIKNNITRRRVLAGIATAGTAGALGSAGTYALLSDTARTRATFTSGSLDLRVHYDTTYEGVETQTDSGVIDGAESVELFDRGDLKPGDSGRMKFCFDVTTNPAYLWVCGDLTAGNDSDLADAIETTLRYCGSDGTAIGGENRSLSSVFADLAGGVPLDYDGTDATPGEQTAYEPSSGSGITGPCLCIEWELPAEVGNEIQSDELSFDLTFHAVQARHNDGTDAPCGGDDGRDSDDGDGDDGGGPDRKAISFVAFGYTGEEPAIDLTITETKDGDEPLAISWSADPAVDAVVLKTGGGKHAIENFSGGTSGTATVGAGTSRTTGQEPNDPYPNGSAVKFEYDEGTGSFQRE